MSRARQYAWRCSLALAVTVAAGGYVRHRVGVSQQERYRHFFESKGLCFQSWETGTRGHVRWVSVRPCGENDHYPAKDITTEVELNTSLDCSPVELEFIDIDGDDVPEVHVSGFDNDTTHTAENRGNNFFRYDAKTNTLVPIPLEAVPRKWKDRYPEDSECVGVFP
jgi:hypothetical protein